MVVHIVHPVGFGSGAFPWDAWLWRPKPSISFPADIYKNRVH